MLVVGVFVSVVMLMIFVMMFEVVEKNFMLSHVLSVVNMSVIVNVFQVFPSLLPFVAAVVITVTFSAVQLFFDAEGWLVVIGWITFIIVSAYP